MIYWIKCVICGWLSPAFLPWLDHVNKKNLEQYYKIQNDMRQESRVQMDVLNAWMETTAKEYKISSGQHAEKIEALRAIVTAINGSKP